MENIPRGYQKTKVGIIPNDWELARTDSVLQRVKNKVEVVETEEYQQIGIRSHAKGIFHKELVTGEELGNKSVFWIKENCFIVNIVFAWEHAIAKTTESEKGMIASHRFPMYEPKDNKVDIDYILYFFKSKRGKHLLGLASPGGAGRNKTLGQGEFSGLKIPVPSIAEQRKIVEVLTTIDNLIIKQEEFINSKAKQFKGLMQKLLCMDSRKNGLREVNLGSIGETYNGLTGKTSEDFINGNSKFITYKNIFANSKIDKSLLGTVQISENDKQHKVKYGDIFFTISSEIADEIGMSSVLLDNFKNVYLNSFCFAYRLDNFETLLPEYARFYFRSFYFRDKIMRLAQGSTRYNLSKIQVMKIKIFVPSLDEQKEVTEVLNTADGEINLLKNELDQFKNKKKYLIQKLLSGEVRVDI